MTTITKMVELVKLIADEGMTITNGTSFGKEVYLGCNDSVDGWYEITDSEAEVLREQLLANDEPSGVFEDEYGLMGGAL